MSEAFLLGILAYLDTILTSLERQLAAGSQADEQAAKALAVFLLYEDDLAAFATKSTTKFDDTFIAEIKETATKVLPPAVVAAIESIKIRA